MASPSQWLRDSQVVEKGLSFSRGSLGSFSQHVHLDESRYGLSTSASYFTKTISC
jgi:hypothetical protein